MLSAIREIVLTYWTVTIFLPAILVLIATIAFITRIVDRVEDRRRSRPAAESQVAHRSPAESAGNGNL
jgi:hypothetical protein